ncbi:mediator of DNA damage checkpoint protein 1-like isoform X2 [Culicoides brevitarsis]|uniref:mediator of DNA damage checkpoint protein 1-like isoform X2 n=1 Tax=Culicoides brevitarsis TaxID=469753 RepID=UPI00307C5F28
MQNEQKMNVAAILSDGDISHSLYPGITIIGKEEGNLRLNDENIESRHAGIRISLVNGAISAEINDFCTKIGTKIDNELIPTGEWKQLKSENWVTFGEKSLKFTFRPSDDDSEVISCSPEPIIRVRRRCRSMIQSQTSPIVATKEVTTFKSDSCMLVPSSQRLSNVPLTTKTETNDDFEDEIIPETQQMPETEPVTMSDEASNDSEFVFVEGDTQANPNLMNSQLLQSQIVPLGETSFDVNVNRSDNKSIIIEKSVDGSMHLQLDVTPSQNVTRNEDLPDIFKDTESLPDENDEPTPDIPNRDDAPTPDLPNPDEKIDDRAESVTPDLNEIEQAAVDSPKSGKALTSIASTESKTTIEGEGLITEDDNSTLDGHSSVDNEEIYNAATQKFNPNTSSVDKNTKDDSDDDIFFAPTQKIPSPLTRKIAKPEPVSPEVDPSIYECATQRLNTSEKDEEPHSSTRDDNIYDALTQVIPPEFFATPVNIPEPVDEDTNDSDYKSADSKNKQESPKTTPEDSIFFDSFSQLNTPHIFKGKLPQPIQVKEEDEEKTPLKRENGMKNDDQSPIASPAANSTMVKRKIFHNKKSNLFAHLQGSPCPMVDPNEQSTNLEHKKKSDRSYFFEDIPTDATETPSADEISALNDSRTRFQAKPKVAEPPKKAERRFPKLKPPTMLPPASSFSSKTMSPNTLVKPDELKKRSKSAETPAETTSREPSGRKRIRSTKLSEDFVTSTQMDNMDFEEPVAKKSSPLQEKPTKPETRTRSCRVVVKPVAAVATALPESISPEEKINTRKRKAMAQIFGSDSEEEEEQKAKSPQKLRKVKTEINSETENRSNEPLKKTLTSKSRSKREPKVKKEVEQVPDKVKTRLQDAPKQKILFTMVSSANYESKIKKTGHSLATSISEATVLVTNKVYRSAKFLSALSMGLPIVTDEWLKAFPTKLDYNIEKYLINDSISEDKYKFSLRGSLEDIQKNGAILKDFTIICSPNTKPVPDEVKLIVESSGGKFSDKIDDLPKKKDEKCLVVADASDKKFIRDAKKKDSKVKILTTEAFMLSVLRNELVLEKKLLL